MTDVMTAKQTIIDALPAAELFARYGAEVKGNKCLCPFHADKTPSLSFYADGKRWHCFGCGEGGNVIDAVMLFEGLTFTDAVKKLDADLGLGFFKGGGGTPREVPFADAMAAVRRQRELKKKLRDAALLEYYSRDAFLKSRKSNDFENEEEEKKFWQAVQERDAFENIYEFLGRRKK